MEETELRYKIQNKIFIQSPTTPAKIFCGLPQTLKTKDGIMSSDTPQPPTFKFLLTHNSPSSFHLIPQYTITPTTLISSLHDQRISLLFPIQSSFGYTHLYWWVSSDTHVIYIFVLPPCQTPGHKLQQTDHKLELTDRKPCFMVSG